MALATCYVKRRSRRGLLSLNGTQELAIELPANVAAPFPMITLVGGIINLLPEQIQPYLGAPFAEIDQHGPMLQDLRGRPSETYTATPWGQGSELTSIAPHPPVPGVEELLFLSGSFATEIRNDKLVPPEEILPGLAGSNITGPDLKAADAQEIFRRQQGQPQKQQVGFTLHLLSTFSHFEGTQQIFYQLKTAAALLPKLDALAISVHEVMRQPEFTVDAVRLGLEFFTPRLFGSMIGLAPTISARFYLEANTTLIRAFAMADSWAGQPNKRPIVNAILESMSRTLEQAHVCGDFPRELE